ncbi:unnamed protein product, partial [Amoebophrya sp. A120]
PGPVDGGKGGNSMNLERTVRGQGQAVDELPVIETSSLSETSSVVSPSSSEAESVSPVRRGPKRPKKAAMPKHAPLTKRGPGRPKKIVAPAKKEYCPDNREICASAKNIDADDDEEQSGAGEDLNLSPAIATSTNNELNIKKTNYYPKSMVTRSHQEQRQVGLQGHQVISPAVTQQGTTTLSGPQEVVKETLLPLSPEVRHQNRMISPPAAVATGRDQRQVPLPRQNGPATTQAWFFPAVSRNASHEEQAGAKNARRAEQRVDSLGKNPHLSAVHPNTARRIRLGGPSQPISRGSADVEAGRRQPGSSQDPAKIPRGKETAVVDVAGQMTKEQKNIHGHIPTPARQDNPHMLTREERPIAGAPPVQKNNNTSLTSGKVAQIRAEIEQRVEHHSKRRNVQEESSRVKTNDGNKVTSEEVQLGKKSIVFVEEKKEDLVSHSVGASRKPQDTVEPAIVQDYTATTSTHQSLQNAIAPSHTPAKAELAIQVERFEHQMLNQFSSMTPRGTISSAGASQAPIIPHDDREERRRRRDEKKRQEGLVCNQPRSSAEALDPAQPGQDQRQGSRLGITSAGSLDFEVAPVKTSSVLSTPGGRQTASVLPGGPPLLSGPGQSASSWRNAMLMPGLPVPGQSSSSSTAFSSRSGFSHLPFAFAPPTSASHVPPTAQAIPGVVVPSVPPQSGLLFSDLPSGIAVAHAASSSTSSAGVVALLGPQHQTRLPEKPMLDANSNKRSLQFGPSEKMLQSHPELSSSSSKLPLALRQKDTKVQPNSLFNPYQKVPLPLGEDDSESSEESAQVPETKRRKDSAGHAAEKRAHDKRPAVSLVPPAAAPLPLPEEQRGRQRPQARSTARNCSAPRGSSSTGAQGRGPLNKVYVTRSVAREMEESLARERGQEQQGHVEREEPRKMEVPPKGKAGNARSRSRAREQQQIMQERDEHEQKVVGKKVYNTRARAASQARATDIREDFQDDDDGGRLPPGASLMPGGNIRYRGVVIPAFENWSPRSETPYDEDGNLLLDRVHELYADKLLPIEDAVDHQFALPEQHREDRDKPKTQRVENRTDNETKLQLLQQGSRRGGQEPPSGSANQQAMSHVGASSSSWAPATSSRGEHVVGGPTVIFRPPGRAGSGATVDTDVVMQDAEDAVMEDVVENNPLPKRPENQNPANHNMAAPSSPNASSTSEEEDSDPEWVPPKEEEPVVHPVVPMKRGPGRPKGSKNVKTAMKVAPVRGGRGQSRPRNGGGGNSGAGAAGGGTVVAATASASCSGAVVQGRGPLRAAAPSGQQQVERGETETTRPAPAAASRPQQQ